MTTQEAINECISRGADAVAGKTYVVWSNEHRAWWRPNSSGYTRHVERAGRYTRDEALSISFKARNGWDRYELPSEIAVRIQDLPDWAQDEINKSEPA